jgi:hypothetical protein
LPKQLLETFDEDERSRVAETLLLKSSGLGAVYGIYGGLYGAEILNLSSSEGRS